MYYGIDYAKFHPDCQGVEIINSAKGLLIHCPSCKVVGDLLDNGIRISNADSAKVGKGIERAEYHFSSEQKSQY